MSIIDLVDKILARNDGDKGKNDLIDVLAKHGYRKYSEGANDRFFETIKLRLDGEASTEDIDRLQDTLAECGYTKATYSTTDRFFSNVEGLLRGKWIKEDLDRLESILRNCGYVKAAAPTTAESPEAFAARVATALGDSVSIYHDALKGQLALCGYFPPKAKAKPDPNLFEIDLTGIPVELQEVFKVHVDLMFGGLIDGEKKRADVDLLQWDHESFNVIAALQLAFKNILKGHMSDASNFLMFIKARGWNATWSDFANSIYTLPEKMEQPIEVYGTRIPLMRPVQKSRKARRPNTAFYSQTHGRDVSDSYISTLKDELHEGKLHWIRAVPGYDDLFNILALAYDQAARGKGKERHANSKPFSKQPLFELADKFGTGFLLGQAAKKLEESTGLTYGPDVKELLGTIVYTSAGIMHLEMEAERNNDPDGLDEDTI